VDEDENTEEDEELYDVETAMTHGEMMFWANVYSDADYF